MVLAVNNGFVYSDVNKKQDRRIQRISQNLHEAARDRSDRKSLEYETQGDLTDFKEDICGKNSKKEFFKYEFQHFASE